MAFLILLIFPLIIALLGFIFFHTITFKETLLQIGAQIIIAGISTAIIYHASTGDIETLNGYVTSKKQVEVSCSHSYQCNCYTTCSGTGKNQTCTEHCSTCYDHSNDWDWDVYTTVGTFEISRIDRRGSGMPPRWASVKINDPVATPHSYDNYIKAAPYSLFRTTGIEKKYKKLPEYPHNFYDYYNLNRLVTSGMSLTNASDWNKDLMYLNADLGAKKQVNIIIVLTLNQPQEWFFALREKWIGGKKNDAILVVSVDNQMKPQWARVMAWTTNKVLEVKLRDAIMDLPNIERKETIRVLRHNVDNFFKRKPMADFEYLTSRVTPSTTEWVVSMIIGLVSALILAFLMHKHDVFGDENNVFKNTWR